MRIKDRKSIIYEDAIGIWIIVTFVVLIISGTICAARSNSFYSQNLSTDKAYEEKLENHKTALQEEIENERNAHIARSKRFQSKKYVSVSEKDFLTLLLKDNKNELDERYLSLLTNQNLFNGLTQAYGQKTLVEVLKGAELPEFQVPPPLLEPEPPEHTVFDHETYWFWVGIVYLSILTLLAFVFVEEIYNPYVWTYSSFPFIAIFTPPIFALWLFILFLGGALNVFFHVKDKYEFRKAAKAKERKEQEKIKKFDSDLQVLYRRLCNEISALSSEVKLLPHKPHTEAHLKQLENHIKELEVQLSSVFSDQENREHARDAKKVTEFGLRVLETVTGLKQLATLSHEKTTELADDATRNLKS